MSYRNGDRSRCERLRKQKRVLRQRNRDLRSAIEGKAVKKTAKK